MSSFLPAPIQQYKTNVVEAEKLPMTNVLVSSSIPKYLCRKEAGFLPRALTDFEDGGAFPEIHLSQFPLDMGRKDKVQSSRVLSLSVTKEGKASYSDSIAKQGHRAEVKNNVYSSFNSIVEKKTTKEELELPTRDEEEETAAKTKLALQELIQGKIRSSKPVNIQGHKSVRETSKYIRYTPNQGAPGSSQGTGQQRIIRMVEAQVDPMEPPKFKHTKAPRGPPSPPVPVLHSPPRKISVKDQQSWKIPPCVSNWKNAKGYTIPLDKRLAADGRGLQQVTINDNFASFSEALSIAERKARQEVEQRNNLQKELSRKEKERTEVELRDMAAKARMERAGITQDMESERSPIDEGEDETSHLDRKQRDKIRYERKREREREVRMEKIGKKGKIARDDDRDISEKIALGQLQGTGKGKAGADGMFDSRLFNQSQGMDAGFGQDDEYNVYSKPLRDQGAANVYRPKGDSGHEVDGAKMYEDLKKTQRFKADKKFRGTDEQKSLRGIDGRAAPVEFEYGIKADDGVGEKTVVRETNEVKTDDPFGIDQFLSDAKNGKRAMDGIGKSGGGALNASAGSKSREHYEGGSSRTKINFETSKDDRRDRDDRQERSRGRRSDDRSRDRSRDRSYRRSHRRSRDRHH